MIVVLPDLGGWFLLTAGGVASVYILGLIFSALRLLCLFTFGLAWAVLDGLLVTPISRMANNVVDRLWAIDHKAPVGSEPAPHTKDAQ